MLHVCDNRLYCILRGRIKGFDHSITTIMCEDGSWGEPERAPHWSKFRVIDHSQKITDKNRRTYSCFHICSCNGS